MKPSIADAIAQVLGGECRARCMDDDSDREVTIQKLRAVLTEVVFDWIEETVECAVTCGLDAAERHAYVSEMVNEALHLTE